MSSADAITQSVYPVETMLVSDKSIPRLENGDRLTLSEFERRYDSMPNLKKAELIEGEVYMSSPVSISRQAQPHALVIGWMIYYMAKTPGLTIADNGTNELDKDNMPQPDVMLLLPQAMGGRAYLDEKDYVAGSPELVCEVAASNVSLAVGKKLDVYRRNGVQEYLVVRTEDQVVDWFRLVDGRYDPIPVTEDGLLKSISFPGLWLNPAALLAADLAKLFAGVDEGIATEEHQEFVKKLAAK